MTEATIMGGSHGGKVSCVRRELRRERIEDGEDHRWEF